MSTLLRRGRWWVLLVVAALALAACADDGDEPADTDGADDTDEDTDGEDDDESADDGEDGEDADLEGETVTIMSPFTDDEEANFLSTIEPWAEEHGVEIEHEGSDDFETLINTRVEGGNPPDLALFPQPGLMRDVADVAEDMRDLSEVVDLDTVEESLIEGTLGDGEYDGRQLGLMYRINLKSLVWYPVPEFEEAGYSVPETWDELVDLSDQMVEDGNVPWCIGIESSGATGWPATDWIEDIMLRTAGLEATDDWVAGELPFASEEVQGAFELWADLTNDFDDEYVLGGRTGVVTTPFGDSPNAMFEEPPACFMHRQAQFIEGFFPDEVQESPSDHVDFFPFPEIDSEHGTPALTAGDIVSLFGDNPAAEELVAYMATPEAGEPWAEAGAFLSPHTTFDTDLYANDIARRQGEFLTEASFARFDPSDDMPADVGTGAFWTEVTDWIAGEAELEEALEGIDEAYPE
ncbi:MAG: ABC transporter substrate-binding protein [Actinomycetota bacterium]